jgi:hypothetical protein
MDDVSEENLAALQATGAKLVADNQAQLDALCAQLVA